MKRIISLVLTFCLLAIPLLGLAEEHVAQTTPAVHRQDYDYSGVDTSKPYNVLMYLVGNKLPGTDAVVEEINKVLSAEYNTTLQIEYLPWSDYKNIRVPTSYMAAHSDFDFVGNFDEGRDAGLLHVADHHVSPGKKQWTWGCGDFGKTWDRNLTDEDGPYIELMTGVYCDNQPDFTWLKHHEEKNFVQYFMPYKTVGRVSNATRDVILGVDRLNADGKVVEAAPFASEKPVQGVRSRIKVYASGEYPGAQVIVCCGGREIYRKTVDLSPRAAFTDEMDVLHDYTIRVTAADGRTLCA